MSASLSGLAIAAAGTHHQLGPQDEGASGRYAVTFAATDVATTALPHAVYRDTFIDGRLRRYELAALPLAADGATVDMILTGTWFR